MLHKIRRFWNPRFMVPSTQFAQAITPIFSPICFIRKLMIVNEYYLDGIFGPNTSTSSQLACQLSWQSAAPVSQRSWVHIPYGPEFFSGPIFNYLFQQCSQLRGSLNFINTDWLEQQPQIKEQENNFKAEIFLLMLIQGIN